MISESDKWYEEKQNRIGGWRATGKERASEHKATKGRRDYTRTGLSNPSHKIQRFSSVQGP